MNPFDKSLHRTSVTPESSAKYKQNLKTGEFYNTGCLNPVTQKARGISFLMNNTSSIKDTFGWNVPKHLLFKAGKTFSDTSFNYPVRQFLAMDS